MTDSETSANSPSPDHAPSTCPPPSAYAAAGVDIDAATHTKERIRDAVRSTYGPEVISDVGGFGGLFAPDLSQSPSPVLVASTDSVGTKLKVAFATGIHNTVGRDIVAHCANDILVQGARPLFFLDYIGIGHHDSDVVTSVIEGVAEGCRECGCALLGGEMAELPEFYNEGEYDLVGTIIGQVDRSTLIDGSSIAAGDILIGLPSVGLHTNGYSLARRILFQQAGLSVDSLLDGCDATVGEVLLAPHKPYIEPVLALAGKIEVRGLAHITGGGITDNLPRIFPSGLGAIVCRGTWKELPVFGALRGLGDVTDQEMFRVFNMGVGMVVVVSPDQADGALEILRSEGEDPSIIGEIVPDPSGTAAIS